MLPRLHGRHAPRVDSSNALVDRAVAAAQPRAGLEVRAARLGGGGLVVRVPEPRAPVAEVGRRDDDRSGGGEVWRQETAVVGLGARGGVADEDGHEGGKGCLGGVWERATSSASLPGLVFASISTWPASCGCTAGAARGCARPRRPGAPVARTVPLRAARPASRRR